jgi:GntR family transcriptional regulator/MocR family aminotransferase
MDGADFLQLDPGRVARGERTDWLTARIREGVLGRALATGARLPSTRVLAGELGFSRGTVTEAYRRLTEEGLIAGSAGAGTIVVAPTQHRARASELADQKAAGTAAHRPDAPEAIDLASGLPDLSAFPRTAWLRAEKEVLATATSRQLGYGLPEGAEELRR